MDMALLCVLCVAAAAPAPDIVFVLLDDVGFNDLGEYSARAAPGAPPSAIPTPTMDALARDGVRLSHYYSQPTCTPTRASLMTGRYAVNHGLAFPLTPGSPAGLPRSMATLPEELAKLGYARHMVGKWHLGHALRAHQPVGRGFESHLGCYMWDIESHTKQFFMEPWRNARHIDWVHDVASANGSAAGARHVLDPTHATEAITRGAERVMREHAAARAQATGAAVSRPLFLYVAYTAAHSPLQPMPRHAANPACRALAHSWRRDFCGMVVGLDEGVANLTRTLRRSLGDNALLIVSSDNGGSTWFGGLNTPLRGGKTTPFEGGVRVPAFAVDFSPGRVHLGGGAQWGGLMHVSDWMPTLLSLAGASPSAIAGVRGGAMDGLDLAGAIRQRRPSPRTELLHEVQFWSRGDFPFEGEDLISLRSGRWKLVDGVARDPYWYAESRDDSLNSTLFGGGGTGGSLLLQARARSAELAIRALEWWFGVGRFDSLRIQLTHVYTHAMFSQAQVRVDEQARGRAGTGADAIILPSTRLFDMETDPNERRNIASRHPDQVRRMRERVAELERARLVPAVKWWVGLHPFSTGTERGLVPGDCSAMPELAARGEHCMFASAWVGEDVDDPMAEPRHQFDAVSIARTRIALVLRLVGGGTLLLTLLAAWCCCCRGARGELADDSETGLAKEKGKGKQKRD